MDVIERWNDLVLHYKIHTETTKKGNGKTFIVVIDLKLHKSDLKYFSFF